MSNNKKDLFISAEILGKSLAWLIIKLGRQFSFQYMVNALFSVLQSLKEIKDAGVAHCDIRPDNILVNTGSSTPVKLADFGSAMIEEDLARVKGDLQKMHYRAPEVTLGYQLTLQIDMWSFGCTVYELLTHNKLFSYDCPLRNLVKAMAITGNYQVGSFPESKKKREIVINNKFVYSHTEEGYLKVIVPRIFTDFGSDFVIKKKDPELVDFILKCLDLNAANRMTVEQALDHPLMAIKKSE